MYFLLFVFVFLQRSRRFKTEVRVADVRASQTGSQTTAQDTESLGMSTLKVWRPTPAGLLFIKGLNSAIQAQPDIFSRANSLFKTGPQPPEIFRPPDQTPMDLIWPAGREPGPPEYNSRPRAVTLGREKSYSAPGPCMENGGTMFRLNSGADPF